MCQPKESDDLPGRIAERRLARNKGMGSVRPLDHILKGSGLPGVEHGLIHLAEMRSHVSGKKIDISLPENLRFAAAQELDAGPVHQQILAVEVFEENRVGRALDHHLDHSVGFCQLGLGGLARRNVGDDGTAELLSVPGEKGDRHLDGEGPSALCPVGRLDDQTSEAFDVLPVRRPALHRIVRIDLADAHPQQLVPRVFQPAAHGLIGRQDASLRIHQEHALGGLVHGELLKAQGRLYPLTLGDVPRDRAGDGPFAVILVAEGYLDREFAAVLAAMDGLIANDFTAPQRLQPRRISSRVVPGGNIGHHQLQQLFPRVAEGAAGLLVRVNDALLLVGEQNGVGRAIDDMLGASQTRFADKQAHVRALEVNQQRCQQPAHRDDEAAIAETDGEDAARSRFQEADPDQRRPSRRDPEGRQPGRVPKRQEDRQPVEQRHRVAQRRAEIDGQNQGAERDEEQRELAGGQWGRHSRLRWLRHDTAARLICIDRKGTRCEARGRG